MNITAQTPCFAPLDLSYVRRTWGPCECTMTLCLGYDRRVIAREPVERFAWCVRADGHGGDHMGRERPHNGSTYMWEPNS